MPEIPELRVSKFRNFGIDKISEFPDFWNSEITIIVRAPQPYL